MELSTGSAGFLCLYKAEYKKNNGNKIALDVDICEEGEESFKISGSTPWPKTMPIFSIGGSVTIARDGSRWDVTGCLEIALECEDVLERFYLGWAKELVCDIISLEGSICSDYDFQVNGMCWESTDTVYVRRNERYCSVYNSETGECQTRKKAATNFWVYQPEAASFKSKWMVGVDGVVSTSASLWGATASASINLKYWFVKEKDGDVVEGLGSPTGHYISVFVEAEVESWLGDFSVEYQVLPWDGNVACEENRARWGGTPFQKIGYND
jgi:hypothetical protein